MNPIPNTTFHVAGYVDQNGTPTQEIYLVDVRNQMVQLQAQPNTQGFTFGGETDVINKLYQHVAIAGPNQTWQPLPYYDLPIQFFTIQDAIDFSVYLIEITINTMRFQARPKTVGGPVDVLVIRPSESIWIKQKILHV
jgi:hypothetical protein